MGTACGDGDSASKIDAIDDGHAHAADELDAHLKTEATYVANAADFVSAADWDSMLTVRVDIEVDPKIRVFRYFGESLRKGLKSGLSAAIFET